VKSARLAAIVGVLVIGSAVLVAAPPASAATNVFVNPDRTADANDLDIQALGIDYNAETITVQASLEHFDPAPGFTFNVYLTPTQRTLADDPNYINLTAQVNGNSQILTGSSTTNGVTVGPNTISGASISVQGPSALTFTVPLGGATGAQTFFVWASLSTPGASVNAGIPVVGGIVGFGPLNQSVVETSTSATLTSPTQVHNSTPATVLVSVNPTHGSGAIDIMDGSRVVATESYNGFDVSINLPKTLAYGTHTLVARYRSASPASYGDSASAPLSLAVLSGGTRTKTTLSISKGTQHYKKAAARVKVTVTHKPAGKVTIYDGTKRLKTLTLKRGTVTYTLSRKLAKGKHKLHVEFTPTHIDSYAPSISKSHTLKVVT
jgi:hypothetical protein